MRRNVLSAALLVLVVGVSVPASASHAGPAGVSALPGHGVQFGAYVQPGTAHTGPDRRTAVTKFSQLIGRNLGIERIYYLWNENFPTADDLWSRDRGTRLFVSWGLGRHNKTGVTWADIAAGRQDARIDIWAAGIKRFGAPMYFSFHHEPEVGQDLAGTPAQYIAAYRHVHDRFLQRGVTNVTFVQTLIAVTYANGNLSRWYPGNGYVDVLAADGNNWFSCDNGGTSWRTFQSIFQGFYTAGKAKGKPMIIAEYATSEDPRQPSRKATWFSDAARTLKSWPQIRAVSYLQVTGGHGCSPRFVDTSTASLKAFRAMAGDAYFAG